MEYDFSFGPSNFDQPEDAERYWFAFVLFSVKKLNGREADNSNHNTDGFGFNLCQVLRAAKLKYVFFFYPLLLLFFHIDLCFLILIG